MASNVVPFDPARRCAPRPVERFPGDPHYDFHPLWIDGELTFGQIWPALRSVGFVLKVADRGRGFVITKR